jgi:ubiquitin-protein ligase
MIERKVEMTITQDAGMTVTVHASVDEDGDVCFDNLNDRYFTADDLRKIAQMVTELASDIEAEMHPEVSPSLWEYEV